MTNETEYDAIERHAADAHAAGYEPTDAKPGSWIRMERPDGTAIIITPTGPHAPGDDE